MIQKLTSGMLGAALLLAAGCNGWPDATPQGDAEHRPEKFPTYAYATAEAVPMFIAEHHRYMVMPREVNLRGGDMLTVSATPATSAFSYGHDSAPYGTLFVRSADGRVRPATVID